MLLEQNTIIALTHYYLLELHIITLLTPNYTFPITRIHNFYPYTCLKLNMIITIRHNYVRKTRYKYKCLELHIP